MRLQLKRPFSDGTFALDLDPLSLLVRLATTVPLPHFIRSGTPAYSLRQQVARSRRSATAIAH